MDLRVQALSEEHAAELALEAAGNQTFENSCNTFLQEGQEPGVLPLMESLGLDANDDVLSDYVVTLVRRGWLSESGTNNDADYAVTAATPTSVANSFVFPSSENLAARRAKTLLRKQNEYLMGTDAPTTPPRVRM